jgi:hypothetical protein
MPVNQEIKGQLARLLATENLVVEHKRVSTASFDVNQRILVLPVWDKASPVVYDLLVGHEVGHALFTPNEDWTKKTKAPKDFINVVEDARIEKLMKRKYPGLAKCFYKGYQELHSQDFFDVGSCDINKLNLIDRINLNFKIGAYECIDFNEKENEYIVRIDKAETFEEVIAICNDLWEFVKKKTDVTNAVSEHNMQQQSNSSNASSSSEEETQASPTAEDSGESEDKEEVKTDEEDKGAPETSQSPKGGEEVSNTQRSFDDSAEDLTNTNRNYFRDMVYLEVPEIYEDNIIVKNEKIHSFIAEYWKNESACRYNDNYDMFAEVDQYYSDFKKSAQKEVNYLVKEFECRKSADAYARSSTSRTGILDTSKLHTFKYNEDLFKRVTVIPDGKNHGMIFVLDWSGSMVDCLMDTLKQLYNLMWFCRKVQIPFEVYAFTYSWTNRLIDPSYIEEDHPKSLEEHNKIAIHHQFSMLQFFTSDVSNKVFEEQCKNIWRIGECFTRYSSPYTSPAGLDLSGTPLNEAILTLHKIIPNFTNKTGAQKVNVCILTDGESNHIHHHVLITRGDREYMGRNVIDCGKCLRDRKLGMVYKEFESDYSTYTPHIFLRNLKDCFSNVNIIGFRIARTSEFTRMYRSINNKSEETALKTWRKEKSWTFKFSGYDALYVIATTGLSADSNEMKLDDDATKAQITKAFKTMLKAKTVNKKILNSFAEIVS